MPGVRTNSEYWIELHVAQRGAGRIVVDTLAYDAASLTLPANETILQRALRWVGES